MELKFGHRVIGWNFSNDKTRGFFICNDGDDKTPYSIYDPHLNHVHWVNNVELDPDATEFLPGDEVEVSFDKFLQNEWYPAIYLGKYKGEHFVTSTDSATPSGWPRCRYPRGGGGGKYSLNGKTAVIDGKEYELRLK